MTHRLILLAPLAILAACEAPASRTETPPADAPPSDPAPLPSDEGPAPDAPVDGPAPPPTPAEASATQCVQGETHLYSCPMADGRVVSVCVGNRQVSYRYGPVGDPEIDLPVAAGAEGLWRGTGEHPHLRFRSGAYDYVIHSAPDADGVERSGVVVMQGDDKLRQLRCPVTSSQTEIPGGMIPDYVRSEPTADYDDVWF